MLTKLVLKSTYTRTDKGTAVNPTPIQGSTPISIIPIEV